MTFLYPDFLWLVVLLALLIGKYASKRMTALHLCVALLVALALSRPILQESKQDAQTKSKDIIIAFDASYSMRATDIPPSRYAFTKETIMALLKLNPSDNIMLIAFTSNPLLLSPPTTDHGLIEVALQSLNPDFILTKGTSLQALFQKIATLQTVPKNLLVITDGGEESNLGTMVSLVQESSTLLTVLAMGTAQGSTVPNKDGSLLKDKEGHLVVSALNPLLGDLASVVSGNYITPSSSPTSTAEEINTALQKNANTQQNIYKKQHAHQELYWIPLLLAALLFLTLHTRALKYLFILLAFFGIQAQASFLDTVHLWLAYQNYHEADYNQTHTQLMRIENHTLESKMALANTYYKLYRYKEAIQTYQSIRSTSIPAKKQLYYNLANAYAQLGTYDKAREYYVKTLQLGEDVDARHNLKMVALLEVKKIPKLGKSNLKPQGSDQKSDDKKNDKKAKKSKSSQGAGSGGSKKTSKKKAQAKPIPQNTEKAKSHPLGSKVYELINKGYIHETQPW